MTGNTEYTVANNIYKARLQDLGDTKSPETSRRIHMEYAYCYKTMWWKIYQNDLLVESSNVSSSRKSSASAASIFGGRVAKREWRGAYERVHALRHCLGL